MSEFDAARYTISVSKEVTEDGVLFVARVNELPDVELYADSADEVYLDAIDIIETSKEMFDSQGLEFPVPEDRAERQYSGRLPLRVPKTLHRRLVEGAQREGMSLNAYANYLLTQEATLAEIGRKIDDICNREVAGLVDFEQSAAATPTTGMELSFSKETSNVH